LAFTRITTEKFENSFTFTEKKEAITFHVKMQRLNHVSHKNTNSIHLSQNIQNPPFWCIKMPCVTHRDRLDSRPPWFTVNISVSLFRFHFILKGYKQFMFSTEITLGFLWINFFFYFSATANFAYAFFFVFFSEKSCYSYTWDALVCICFMMFWHIFGDLWPVKETYRENIPTAIYLNMLVTCQI